MRPPRDPQRHPGMSPVLRIWRRVLGFQEPVLEQTIAKRPASAVSIKARGGFVRGEKTWRAAGVQGAPAQAMPWKLRLSRFLNVRLVRLAFFDLAAARAFLQLGFDHFK